MKEDRNCPKCGAPGVIDDYYNFGDKKHPIYYCKLCIKYYTIIGKQLIQSRSYAKYLKEERKEI